VAEPIDEAVLRQLAGLVTEATAAFVAYDYSRALKLTEEFFWQFCDDYLELVKDRAYSQSATAESARTALRTTVSVVLRLFAPFLPYVTEEAWSMARTEDGPLPGFTAGSIHRSAWPTPDEIQVLLASASAPDPAVAGVADGAAVSVLTVAADVLRQIRKAKSDAKRSVRAEVDGVVISDTSERIAAVQAVLGDLRAAGNVAEMTTVTVGPEIESSVVVRLRAVEPSATS
jgi:valyl-tRNA synthetase